MSEKQALGYGYQTKRIVSRGINYIKRNGVLPAIRRVFDKAEKNRIYAGWQKENAPSAEELERQKDEAINLSGISDSIVFSVVIPLYNTDRRLLVALLGSWDDQTYRDFELCLADASCDDDFEDHVRGLLSRYTGMMIKYVHLKENKGISENTNAAIGMASGEFIVFCDHDDIVSPDALYKMAKAIENDPKADVLYTDQDKVDSVGKRYYDPFIKPDYDPYLLCSTNYICHLHAIRKSLLDEMGYLDKAYDGSQDYDVTFRACERARAIVHIPAMSYHWRISGNSTADEGDQKLYAYDAGKRAIEEHYRREGIKAKVSMKEDTYGVYHTWFELPEGWEEKVDIVEVTEGVPEADKLSKLISNNARHATDTDASAGAKTPTGPRNRTCSRYILFKNPDITPANPDALAELAGYVMVCGADACGAIAEYPFSLPLKGMDKVDIATFYLTVCPNRSMPVSADYLLVKTDALPTDMESYTKPGWQHVIADTVYNPFALPQEPVMM